MEHTYHFRQLMALVDDCEGLLYQVFSASLRESSLTWFHQLPPHSIHSFAQLCDQFVIQHACNARPRRGIDHLFNLKQNSGEPLRQFIQRFVNEMVQVEKCDQRTTVIAFRKALPPGSSLLRSLAKSGLDTMKVLLSKANKYTNMEDELGNTEGKSKISQVDQAQEWGSAPKRKVEYNQKSSMGHSTKKVPRMEFTIPPRELMIKLQDDPDFQWPPEPVRPPQSPDKSIYYHYHRIHGNQTN